MANYLLDSPVARALRVFVTSPRIARQLQRYDPQALRQARCALIDAGAVALPDVDLQQPRAVTVYSADGIPFEIAFERDADLCWRCQFPAYINAWWLQARVGDSDRVDTMHNGGPVYRSGSLARVMELVATFIGETEF